MFALLALRAREAKVSTITSVRFTHIPCIHNSKIKNPKQKQ